MRRSHVIASIAALALVLVAPRSDLARGAHGSLDRMTLEEQVGQLVVLSFSGTTPPAYVVEALRERRVAGVILFGGNIVSPAQVRALTATLRRSGANPVVAVDQEGGPVRRLPWAPPVASEPEQLARGTVGSAAEAGGRALRSVGVTVSLAPVADVPSVSGAALASRAFARDPTVVAAAVGDAVRGWRAGGVASTAKHFPGLGAARENTDREIVTIRRSRAALEAIDLPPFAAAIAAGVPLVMVGHARYPALDRARIASQSPPIIEGVLRGELGFRGVVVTDSLEARASLATGGIERAAERSIRAGADLLLLTERRSYRSVYRHLLAVAEGSPAVRERVRESAARVLALRRRGALPPR
jgi:beta-N-acetylhexosaminidase